MLRRSLAAVVALTLLGVSAGWAARKVEDYNQTINDFKKSRDVAPFFDSAYGYAVFPNIAKGGLGIGASHGKGQVYRGGTVTGFTKVTNISWGLQAGGQAYSQMIFFEDERAYNDFTSGNFEFGAQANAIAVTAGVSGSAGSEGATAGATAGGSGGSQAARDYHKGMMVFVIGKGGLMYELSIAGQKYGFQPVNQ